MRTGASSLHSMSRRRLRRCCQCQRLDASLQRAQYTANTILQLQKLLYLLEACLAHDVTRWTLSSAVSNNWKSLLTRSSADGEIAIQTPTIAHKSLTAKGTLICHVGTYYPLPLDHVRDFNNFSKFGLTVMSP